MLLDVVVDMPGYDEFRTTVDAEPGQTATVDAALVAATGGGGGGVAPSGISTGAVIGLGIAGALLVVLASDH